MLAKLHGSVTTATSALSNLGPHYYGNSQRDFVSAPQWASSTSTAFTNGPTAPGYLCALVLLNPGAAEVAHGRIGDYMAMALGRSLSGGR